MPNKAASWLFAMRSSRRLSQRRLAVAVGVTNQAISDAERGEASAGTWIRLAEFFGWPVSTVLWMAGIVTREKPMKGDVIARIEADKGRMSEEGRAIAEALINEIAKGD